MEDGRAWKRMPDGSVQTLTYSECVGEIVHLREALQQIVAIKDIGADFPHESGKYVNDSAGERDAMYKIATDALS